MTVYQGLSPDERSVAIFWDILTNRFDDGQRAKFLTFVWGRSRLPQKARDFERKFKLSILEVPNGKSPNTWLPVSHTCFFSLDWPRYDDAEAAYQRLLYAITNCLAIDADSTDAARAAGRLAGVFEEEEEEQRHD